MMVDFLAWASIVSIVFIGAIVVMSLYYYIKDKIKTWT